MYVFDNVLDLDLINNHKNKIEAHFEKMVGEGHDYFAFHPTRNIIFEPNNVIVNLIQNYIESRIKVRLTCYQMELQTWAVGTESDLHIHDHLGRGHGDYNSLLYLNDDFDGGEFFTENGITIKPKTNRLTFFNGKTVGHGVKKVFRNHRYTMIFWWKDTQFYQ